MERTERTCEVSRLNVEPDELQPSTDPVRRQALRATVEAATGAIGEGPRRSFVRLGRIAQHLINHRLVEGLRIEIGELRDAGRIDPEYENSTKFGQTLRELLGYLDADVADDEVFEVLKKILLARAAGTRADEADILPLAFMRIVKQMEASDVILLFDLHAYVTARKAEEGAFLKSDGVHRQRWLEKVTGISSLKYEDLIRTHSENLADLNVLSPTTDDPGQTLWLAAHDRFTDLGWDLCQYLTEYDSE